jgi:hypothetical protein
VNNVYLLSALDQSGLMQANSMGRKLQSTLLFLIPYTLSIAAFPFFCELVDKNDHQKLGELVTRFGRCCFRCSLRSPCSSRWPLCRSRR